MLVIWITGGIGHGKSSLSEALAEHEPSSVQLETSAIITEVVDAMHEQLDEIPQANNLADVNKWLSVMPAILKKVVHRDAQSAAFTLEQGAIDAHPATYTKLFQHLDNLRADSELARQKITPETKGKYRPMLQWVGNFVIEKVAATVWQDENVRRAREAEKAGTKLAIIGGLRYPEEQAAVHSIDNSTIIEVVRPGAEEKDLDDLTERSRKLIRPDVIFVNDGTLSDLKDRAHEMLEDMKNGVVRPQYSCANPSPL